ncbi:hypothetical protein RN51_01713 [Microbacterium oxydans]|uniref:Lipoprotein n=1 Tax=Microbacterium oxydans TaxID=82380 RepID=A0A0F0KPX4_9MICO|nr:hypothetical protein [Microbacterium oxydans]KJL22967.1 hypothetical protein RN51_01713 [Microbacterium oxydans]
MKGNLWPIAAALIVLLPLAGCSASEESIDEMPKPPVMQSAERDSQLQAAQEQAEGLFHDRFPDQPVPEASLIRAVAPSEWSETTATCMTEAGFESHVKSGYVETASFPAEQELAQAIAVYQCRVAYPIDPAYQQPYTAEEATYLYRYLVDTVVPCLDGEGYTVPDVPSEGTFEEQLNSGQEWNPFDSLDPGSEEKYMALMGACPAKPAGFRGN